MLVLHAHWQAPRRPNESGGMLFWAENPAAPQPPIWRGRLPRKGHIRAQPHPYCLDSRILRELIGAGTPLSTAESNRIRLLMPTSRTGPLPSPELIHSWGLDEYNEPFLSQWIIEGLWLPASKAFPVLVNLPAQSRLFILGQDAHYWRKASNLILETLAAQRIVPTITPLNGISPRTYYARWMPVLDGPHDAARLEQLTRAMPPVCRSEALPSDQRNYDGEVSPRALLETFLKDMCDALARSWGRNRLPRIVIEGENPLLPWIEALFSDDPTIQASPAQLQAFSSSIRAWLRNLQAAGDSIFRIAFRIIAPDPNQSKDEQFWLVDFLLQARDDPTLVLPAEEVWRTNGSNLRIYNRRFSNPQEKLLAGLGYAARLFPQLLPALKTNHPTGTIFDTDTAYRFLREAGPMLEQAGFGLMVPPWWNQNNARLGMRLRLMPKDGVSPRSASGRLGLQSLVSFQWELALGNTPLTRAEFEALVALKSPLVQIRGQWVQLDADQVEAAIQFWESQQQNGEISLLQAAQYGLGAQTGNSALPVTEVVAEGWVEDWLSRLSNPEQLSEQEQPQGLVGLLRPYQRYGFSWLLFFRRWGLGAILADDMGLGKTIQALAMLQFEKETQGKLSGPVLLLCPSSVVYNWQREACRFTPALKTMVHQGTNRLRNSDFIETVNNVDLVLTSYAVLRMDAEIMHKVNWYGVIADEAQNIKNPSTKQSQAARKLNSSFRFALTGTPVENRLTELWSIMNFLNPGYLGSLEKFRSEYAMPIERFGDMDTTHRLRQLVGPFILRRVKTDPTVIQDLPEKIEMKEFCNLTEEQATLYEAIVKQTMDKIANSDGIERKGMVLTLLMQLKQVCNHPLQYLHQIQGVGDDISQVAGRSGKLVRLIEMLEEILAEGDRALIFTQFAEMGHLLNGYLPQALERNVQYLYGGTPLKVRDQMVQRFQEDDHAPPIFILSLKAGGFGINLTRANHVFHFDRWWNPAVENQATDRAFRIGQHQNVQVHKFITSGTLEDRIDEMIESKKGLAEAIIGGEESWMTELSTEDLRDLVKLRR
jgi:SNF2 family DNA or RNA helicase